MHYHVRIFATVC